MTPDHTSPSADDPQPDTKPGGDRPDQHAAAAGDGGPDRGPAPSPQPPTGAGKTDDPLLEVDGLTVAYPGRPPALVGVSLRLAPAGVLAVVGPNGAGKSTLLRALLGQLAPRAGRIRWMGLDLSSWNRRRLAQRVGYLPQSPTAMPGLSVADILRLGRSPHHGLFGLDTARDHAAIEAVARDLDLVDLLSRPVETLSGGQRQRVFLARALVCDPGVLLLDEPDTFLDLRHLAALADMLKRLVTTRSIAILIASHDLNLAAAVAGEALVLKAGGVAAAGPAREVFTPATLGPIFDAPLEGTPGRLHLRFGDF